MRKLIQVPTPKLKILLLLALADLITTLVLIYSGIAQEFNPVMNFFLAAHPVLFACAKMLTTSALAIFLAIRAKGTRLGEIAINISLTLMVIVVGWNSFWLFLPTGN